MPYLFVILLIGALIRFYGLTDQSFWIDEIYIAKFVQGLSFSELKNLWFLENHPPLYIITLKGWTKIFGETEWAIRAFSATLGTFSLLIFYKLFHLLSTKKTALICTALAALSPLAVYYSQEVRYFALWIPLSACSFYFFFKWLYEGKNTFSLWTIATILALYTHIFSFFILFIQFVLYLLERGKNERPLASKFALTCLFLSCLTLVWWVWLHVGNSAGFAKPFSLLHFVYLPFTYTLGFSFGPSVRELHMLPKMEIFIKQWWYCGLIFMIIIFTLSMAIPRIFKERKSYHLFLLTLISVSIIVLTPLFSNISFNIRSTLFLAPFFFLYLGMGVEKLLSMRYLKALSIVLILLMLSSLFQYFTDPRYARDDLRNTVAIIKEKPEIPVLTTPVCSAWFLSYYYDEASSRQIENFSPSAIETFQNSPYLFLVWNREWALPNREKYQKYFKAHYKIIKEHNLSGVKVQLVKRL